METVEAATRNPDSWSDHLSRGLQDHLGIAQRKIDVELQQRYEYLCQVDSPGVVGYTADFNNTLDYWSDRILSVQVKVLSVHSPVTSAPVTLPPDASTRRELSLDYRHLPKLSALTFSGKVEEWPEFRRDWNGRYGNLPDAIQLQYLKPALPVKDQSKITAVNSMSECWRRLAKTYGDRTLNIVTVKNNLRRYQPKGGQRWEKIIDLYEFIEKALTQLQVLNAEKCLEDEFELV